MKKYILFSILFLFIHPWQGFTQNNITLKDVLQKTLESNFDILSQAVKVELSKNEVYRGNAGMLPQIVLSGNREKQLSNTELTFFDGTSISKKGANTDNTNLGVSLHQTLFDGMKMFRTYRLLKENLSISEIQYQLEIENNLVSSAHLYLEIIRLQRKLEVQKIALNISQQNIDFWKNKEQFGQAKKSDVLFAQTNQLLDSSQYLQLQQQLHQTSLALQYQTGNQITLPFYAQTPDFVIEKNKISIENNTLLKVAKKQSSISILDYEIAKSARYPTIDLSLGYNFSSSKSDASQVTQRSTNGGLINIGFKMNLFDGNRVRKNIQKGNFNYQYQLMNVDKVSAQLERDAIQAESLLDLLDKRMLFEKEAITTFQQQFEFTQHQYQLGQSSRIEYRQSQQQLNNQSIKITDLEIDRIKQQFIIWQIEGVLLEKLDL